MPRQTTPEETEQRHTMRVVIGAWYALVFALAAVGAWFWRKELFVFGVTLQHQYAMVPAMVVLYFDGTRCHWAGKPVS